MCAVSVMLVSIEDWPRSWGDMLMLAEEKDGQCGSLISLSYRVHRSWRHSNVGLLIT